MLYRISVAERGLTGIGNIFRSRLSGLDDLLQARTVPLSINNIFISSPLVFPSVDEGRSLWELVRFHGNQIV